MILRHEGLFGKKHSFYPCGIISLQLALYVGACGSQGTNTIRLCGGVTIGQDEIDIVQITRIGSLLHDLFGVIQGRIVFSKKCICLRKKDVQIDRLLRTFLHIEEHRIIFFGIEAGRSLRFEDFVLYGGVSATVKGGTDELCSFGFMRHDRLFPRHVIKSVGLGEGVVSKSKLMQRLFVERVGKIVPFGNSAHGSHVTIRTGFEGIFAGMDTGSGDERIHCLNGLIVLTVLPSLVIIRLRRRRGTSNQPYGKNQVYYFIKGMQLL